MSFYNLYVGDASDPKFHWDGGDYSGNIPETILDLGGSIGLTGCAMARNLLESPKYGGKVIDWGSSGARLTKARIIEFLKDFEGSRSTGELFPSRLDALEDDREYILFACEQCRTRSERNEACVVCGRMSAVVLTASVSVVSLLCA